jgi:hypothetical protein
MNKNFNGICYSPLPPGYDPSTANTTCLFFGSDIAYDPMEPIWGNAYTSSTGSSCNLTGPNKARNDIQTLADMGVTLIRLYDWEPRNNHLKFLDYCHSRNIKVLAPVSNYFVKPNEGLPRRNSLILDLINSFSNKDKTDYHPAIAGIIVGNEPNRHGFTAQNCIDFTISWASIEASKYASYRELMIGHPVDFGTYGGQYPCFGFWDPLLAGLNSITTKNLNNRLFLAPQAYNDGEYLYENAQGAGKGYVDLTYEKYHKPILFTEIGLDRTKPNYQNFVQRQLSDSIRYGSQNPDKLIGICFFQFADKVWKGPGDSEGSFGAYSHGGGKMCTITYAPEDFTHWENNCNNVSMTVDTLIATPLHDIVVKNYKTS